MSSKILITGAGGLLGRHLLAELVPAGYAVRAHFHHAPELAPELLAEVEVVTGDLTEPDDVRDWVQGCQTTIHLGAELYESSQFTEVNVTGTLNLLHAALSADCAVLHTSCIDVYGLPLYLPLNERHPLHGGGPYASSKLAADLLVESFFRSYHLPTLILRPSSLYGPGQNSSALLPSLWAQLTDDSPCVYVPNPQATHDWLQVSDAVSAYALALRQLPTLAGSTLQLATGQETPLRELLSLLMQQAGCHKPVKCISSASPLEERQCCDPTQARLQLGWEAQIGWAEGISRLRGRG